MRRTYILYLAAALAALMASCSGGGGGTAPVKPIPPQPSGSDVPSGNRVENNFGSMEVTIGRNYQWGGEIKVRATVPESRRDEIVYFTLFLDFYNGDQLIYERNEVINAHRVKTILYVPPEINETLEEPESDFLPGVLTRDLSIFVFSTVPITDAIIAHWYIGTDIDEFSLPTSEEDSNIATNYAMYRHENEYGFFELTPGVPYIDGDGFPSYLHEARWGFFDRERSYTMRCKFDKGGLGDIVTFPKYRETYPDYPYYPSYYKYLCSEIFIYTMGDPVRSEPITGVEIEILPSD